MGALMNWIIKRKYQTLLLTLVALVFIYPVLGHSADFRVLFDTLLTLVFLASLLVLYADRQLRLITCVIGMPILIGAWMGHFFTGADRMPFAVAYHIITAVFLAFILITLMRKFYRERSVSADAVYASFCGYLLLG